MDKLKALEDLLALYTDEKDPVTIWDDIIPGVKYDHAVIKKLNDFINNSVKGYPHCFGQDGLGAYRPNKDAAMILNHFGIESKFYFICETLFNTDYEANQNGYYAMGVN